MRLRLALFLLALPVGCARRYRTSFEPICPPANDSSRVRVQPDARGSIQGEITDRDTGRLLSGGVLTVASSTSIIRTDTLGRFALTGLSPGRYILHTRQLGYETRTDTVIVTVSAGVHLHLALTPRYVDRCMEMRTVRTPLPWWHFW